jgi:DNA-binding transcriptional ArsR family regulator
MEGTVKESEFQAVRICQALGGTTRYRILRLLGEARMRPADLAVELGKSRSVISVHLYKLKATGLVRFKRQKDGLYYWLKPKDLPSVLRRIESLAESMLSGSDS